MCVIIYIPPKADISMNRLRECHRANPDGWGFMWASNVMLYSEKDTSPWEAFFVAFGAVRAAFIGVPFVIHFRTASMGQITIEACHPHKINDELAFVHNGNLFHFSDYFYTDSRTDSQRFSDFIKTKGPFYKQIYAIERYCVSNYSKMVFMNAKGQVWICNERAGMWENGCWFSNGGIEHYVGYGYSGAYPYRQGEVRHKGGLISVQGYAGDWKQCECCKGWFTDLDKFCPDCEAYYALVGLQ